MNGAFELGDALDGQRVRADAVDARAHLGQALREVADFRLHRGVLQHGLALGQHGRHQHIMGRADRHLGKIDARAGQPLGRLRDHIAAVELQLGAELLQAHQVQIDRPRADRAAAGQRHRRLAMAGQQRPEHPKAGPHPPHQIIRSAAVDDIAGGEMEGLAHDVAVMRALAVHRAVDAMIAQDARQHRDVGEVGHVLQREAFGGEEARDHQRERRIFRAADGNDTVERIAARDANTIHECPPEKSATRRLVKI
jgi:hypothetical protein